MFKTIFEGWTAPCSLGPIETLHVSGTAPYQPVPAQHRNLWDRPFPPLRLASPSGVLPPLLPAVAPRVAVPDLRAAAAGDVVD